MVWLASWDWGLWQSSGISFPGSKLAETSQDCLCSSSFWWLGFIGAPWLRPASTCYLPGSQQLPASCVADSGWPEANTSQQKVPWQRPQWLLKLGGMMGFLGGFFWGQWIHQSLVIFANWNWTKSSRVFWCLILLSQMFQARITPFLQVNWPLRSFTVRCTPMQPSASRSCCESRTKLRRRLRMVIPPFSQGWITPLQGITSDGEMTTTHTPCFGHRTKDYFSDGWNFKHFKNWLFDSWWTPFLMTRPLETFRPSIFEEWSKPGSSRLRTRNGFVNQFAGSANSVSHVWSGLKYIMMISKKRTFTPHSSHTFECACGTDGCRDVPETQLLIPPLPLGEGTPASGNANCFQSMQIMQLQCNYCPDKLSLTCSRLGSSAWQEAV